MSARTFVLALSLAVVAVLASPSFASAQQSPLLDRGDTGEAVAQWQSNLNLWFRFVTPEDRGRLVVDGIYGPSTEEATAEFQRGQGLSATGTVDARTMRTLNGVLGRLIATPYTQRALEWPLRVPQWFWPWARWYLGRSEFEGQARNPAVRPAAAPVPIPDWAWRRLNVLVGADLESRAQMLAHDRIHAIHGSRTVTVSTTLRSERDRYWILVTGSASQPDRSWAVWLRMRESRWVPWQITHLAADPQPVLRPVGAPCDVKPAYAEPEC